MTYTFQQLKDSLNECTSYDLQHYVDEDGEMGYILIDPYGDQDGDPFYDLDDVTDFITNNDQVDEYLYQLSQGGN
jgi:hypothetical protein